MTLTPTSVTIHDKRVWLQDATDKDAEYVDYQSTLGGVHVQRNEKLPTLERIEHGESRPTEKV